MESRQDILPATKPLQGLIPYVSFWPWGETWRGLSDAIPITNFLSVQEESCADHSLCALRGLSAVLFCFLALSSSQALAGLIPFEKKRVVEVGVVLEGDWGKKATMHLHLTTMHPMAWLLWVALNGCLFFLIFVTSAHNELLTLKPHWPIDTASDGIQIS